MLRGDQFIGMVSLDNLLVHLSMDLSDLSRPVTGEVLFPQREPAVPVPYS